MELRERAVIVRGGLLEIGPEQWKKEAMQGNSDEGSQEWMKARWGKECCRKEQRVTRRENPRILMLLGSISNG